MTLDAVRKRIDQIDSQMKPLFLQRMECARDVAAVKAQTGGNVFVPERERAIIEARTEGVVEFRREYEAFLQYMMCLSSIYQYNELPGLRDAIVGGALVAAGLDAKAPHEFVDISFSCSASSSELSVLLCAAEQNGIKIKKLIAESRDGVLEVSVSLAGNINNPKMRALLCQMGSESRNFKICTLC